MGNGVVTVFGEVVATVLGDVVVVDFGEVVGEATGAVVRGTLFPGRLGIGVVTVRLTVVGGRVVKVNAAFFW